MEKAKAQMRLRQEKAERKRRRDQAKTEKMKVIIELTENFIPVTV